MEEPRSSDEHHVRRCPLCGTYYQYDWSHEYLVNGSEDEEVLTRLTPAQARRFLTDQGYDKLMAGLRASLRHESALVRSYAAKSLVSHHLEQHGPASVIPYLQSLDPDVVRGALFFLTRLVQSEHLVEITELGTALAKVSESAEDDLAARAHYVVAELQRRLTRRW